VRATGSAIASHTTARSAACHAGGVTPGSAIDRPHSRHVSRAEAYIRTSTSAVPSTNAIRQPARASARASAASSVMCPAAGA
jgi:hypothetical protein